MSALPQAAAPTLFALAKIQPPRPRVGLVQRPVLEQALGQALQHKRLTLLLAPAGYGKTAALTRQIRLLPPDCALAWLSTDEDDQLQRFLACLSAALDGHDLPWRVAPDALAVLAQGARGLRDVAAEVVNALAGAEVARGLIVVDDAHRIVDPQVFELLQLMLERLPAHWAVAIASRVEPPLPLARWRAAGELAEFRQGELSFSAADVAALLTAADGDADAGTVEAMLARTGGWAAGLRLSLSGASAALPQRASATQRHLFDYLAAEVLDDMPGPLRDFLLRCSVLSELTAGRCALVSGQADAANLLEQIERRSLFVSVLEADEPTLRLHDLFRDFLEDRLLRERPAELPRLLQRAAAAEPDVARALGYLARAGDWDTAARLLVQRGPQMVATASFGLDQLLTLLPAEQFDKTPDLHLLKGLVALMNFNYEAGLASMERAMACFARDVRPQDEAAARAYACITMISLGQLAQAELGLARLRAGELAAPVRAVACYGSIWAEYAHGRSENVAALFTQMLDALEQVPVLALWNQFFFQNHLNGLPGLTPLFERFARSALRISADTPSHVRAGVYYCRAGTALGAGRIDDALASLATADEDCRWLGTPRGVATESRNAHTLIQALRGDAAASRAAAEACEADLRLSAMRSNRLTHEYEVLFIHARAAWILGDEADLRRVDAALQACINPSEYPAAHINRGFSRAFIALLDGRLELAGSLLEPLADEVERAAFFPATQARVMLADVQWRLGQADAAAATLRPWLASALRGERLGGALLAGPVVLARLAAAPWGTRLSGAECALLARLVETLRLARIGAAQAAGPMAANSTYPASGLSPREREVLARMAAGDSNKLIARAFDLSPHTVKRHVANILNKLAVDTRGQAAALWRDDQR
ncbi:hypothetical protein BH11PSE10_BH11PSE10_17100 [soil metagenome]